MLPMHSVPHFTATGNLNMDFTDHALITEHKAPIEYADDLFVKQGEVFEDAPDEPTQHTITQHTNGPLIYNNNMASWRPYEQEVDTVMADAQLTDEFVHAQYELNATAGASLDADANDSINKSDMTAPQLTADEAMIEYTPAVSPDTELLELIRDESVPPTDNDTVADGNTAGAGNAASDEPTAPKDSDNNRRMVTREDILAAAAAPVSYTHLTLPTKRIV